MRAAIGIAAVALLAGAAAALFIPARRPGDPGLTTALPALRGRVARLEERLAALEARGAESDRRLVAIQVNIERLVQVYGLVPTAAAATALPTDGSAKREAAIPEGRGRAEAILVPVVEGERLQLPVRVVPDIRAGDDAQAVISRLGPPDEDVTKGKTRSLKYYGLGVSMSVEPATGKLKSARFFGEPGSDVIDQNGNFGGIFGADGKWYRPNGWSFRGVEIGAPATEVVERLGQPDRASQSQNGELAFYYKALDIVVYMGPGPIFRVRGFRMGGGDVVIDQNGNQW